MWAHSVQGNTASKGKAQSLIQEFDLKVNAFWRSDNIKMLDNFLVTSSIFLKKTYILVKGISSSFFFLNCDSQ